METVKSEIAQIDIVEVIQRYVPLKRSGQNYVGLCPFHAEKTPSFSVSPKRGMWKCFGCGEGGDVVTFIQKYENKGFKDAMNILNLKTFPKSPKVDFKPLPPPKKLSAISPELVKASMQFYDYNNFVIGLYELFDIDLTYKAIETFNIGTSERWKGATAFWYIDQETKTRQVKVMLYNSDNLKRVKKEQAPNIGKSKALFYGTTLLKKKGIKEPCLSACFFGEHQLNNNNDNKPIAIVESEKTAILMTIFGWMDYPIARKYIWLATGGQFGVKWDKPEASKVLEGRDVVLFPDLDAHDKWVELSFKLTGCNVKVSPFLLKYKKQNVKDKRDIADFFLSTYLYEKRLFNTVTEIEKEFDLPDYEVERLHDDNIDLPKNLPKTFLSPSQDYYVKVNKNDVIFYACYDGSKNHENGNAPKKYVSITSALEQYKKEPSNILPISTIQQNETMENRSRQAIGATSL